MRIDMDGDKEIGFIAVCEPGSVFQLNEHITVPSHQHAHAGLPVQKLTKLEPHPEGNILLLGLSDSPCAWISPSMTRIDHDGRVLLGAQYHRLRGRRG